MRNKFASWERRYFLRTMATGLFGAAGSTAFGAAQVTASASSQYGDGPKITGIKTYKFNVATGQAIRDPSNRQAVSSPFKTWLFLKVETDQGIDGWGEGSIEWLSPVIEATLHEWKPLLLGRNALDVVTICNDITNRLPWKGGPVIGTAIAAVNMALYDIAGKTWGVPVYQILGGKQRDRIKIYNGGINFESVELARRGARVAVDRGARGLKGNPLESRTWPMDYEALKHSVSIVKAVREEVGPDVELMLDTHGSPSPELSIAFAEMVAPYRPLFLEEPVKVGSVNVLKEVSSKSPVPIATGEKLFAYREFKEVVDARACAFLQPDVSHSFGITNFVHIARLAEEAQMLMAPHNAGGPIHFAAMLQADAVVSNFLIQEVSGYWMQRFGEYVDHDFEFKNGFIELNDRPGLGIGVKEEHIAQLPYDESMSYRQYRNADGSWKGW
ncbi:MAG: mandelate racemase/muconate lactonizing enzyme family protein [Bryobacterales bacterium]|nr:mandelate racemase/muconate lactonizing enzyme family protein [Bryobacterales bacterium]MDE0436183.1 mandelate racemase/muconate lactonizing enzyme family protein [Bryobacterales bacterium]